MPVTQLWAVSIGPVPLTERPIEVVTRVVPGHREGCLIKGARDRSAVGTPVERTPRLVLLAGMDVTDATSAREGFTRKLRPVPVPLGKTLTYHRGKEMDGHERLAKRRTIRVFIADSHAPWQRGTNENPKGTDLSSYTQCEVNAIAHRLNKRPRKGLTFPTPLEVQAQ